MRACPARRQRGKRGSRWTRSAKASAADCCGRQKKEPESSSVGEAAASDKSQRSVSDAAAGMGMACTDSVGRMAAALGAGPATSRFVPCRDVSMGGVLCALPALRDNGLFAHLEKLPALPSGYYQQVHIIFLLACMALCRIRTAEQLRNQPPGELGKLLGLDRIPEVRTLREKMDAEMNKIRLMKRRGEITIVFDLEIGRASCRERV